MNNLMESATGRLNQKADGNVPKTNNEQSGTKKVRSSSQPKVAQREDSATITTTSIARNVEGRKSVGSSSSTSLRPEYQGSGTEKKLNSGQSREKPLDKKIRDPDPVRPHGSTSKSSEKSKNAEKNIDDSAIKPGSSTSSKKALSSAGQGEGREKTKSKKSKSSMKPASRSSDSALKEDFDGKHYRSKSDEIPPVSKVRESSYRDTRADGVSNSSTHEKKLKKSKNKKNLVLPVSEEKVEIVHMYKGTMREKYFIVDSAKKKLIDPSERIEAPTMAACIVREPRKFDKEGQVLVQVLRWIATVVKSFYDAKNKNKTEEVQASLFRGQFVISANRNGHNNYLREAIGNDTAAGFLRCFISVSEKSDFTRIVRHATQLSVLIKWLEESVDDAKNPFSKRAIFPENVPEEKDGLHAERRIARYVYSAERRVLSGNFYKDQASHLVQCENGNYVRSLIAGVKRPCAICFLKLFIRNENRGLFYPSVGPLWVSNATTKDVNTDEIDLIKAGSHEDIYCLKTAVTKISEKKYTVDVGTDSKKSESEDSVKKEDDPLNAGGKNLLRTVEEREKAALNEKNNFDLDNKPENIDDSEADEKSDCESDRECTTDSEETSYDLELGDDTYKFGQRLLKDKYFQKFSGHNG